MTERQETCADHCQEADAGHEQEPGVGAGKHRVQARDEEDAGLDHRCGMQEGADRRRGFHGVREPDEKRALRGFGETADEDEDERHREERVCFDGLNDPGACEHFRNAVCAGDRIDEEIILSFRPGRAVHGSRCG